MKPLNLVLVYQLEKEKIAGDPHKIIFEKINFLFNEKIEIDLIVNRYF